MISVCQLYTDFKGAMNTWQGGHFRPQSFEAAMHHTSMQIFNSLRKSMGNNQVIDDNLKVFLKSVQVPIKNFPTGGVIAYPTDYSMFSNLRFYSKKVGGKGVMCSSFDIMDKESETGCRPLREEEKVELEDTEKLIERNVDKIDNQRWASFCEDEFLPPSMDNVGCTQFNEGFKIMPNVGYAVLDYLAIPERPKFVYYKDARQNLICEPDKCVNLLWGEEMLPEFMSILKTKYASFVSNGQKYMEGEKETQNVGS